MIAPSVFRRSLLAGLGVLFRQRQFYMRLGGLGLLQAQFDSAFAQQIAPVAFLYHSPVQFDGVLDALAAVAAL